MANFVLVHGAWGGGYQYNNLSDRLTAAGHKVLIAQLTGLGARTHLANARIDLACHIQDVVAQIEDARLKEFILVGHSYGGMVITGVMAQLGRCISHIVYLDALLPDDGQSLWDLTGDWEHNHYINGQRDTPGLTAPLPGIGNNRDLSAHPLLTLVQPVKYTGKEKEVTRRTYIFAAGWNPTPFRQFHDKVKNDPAWNSHEIDCGHVVMADKPEELLAILLDTV